MKTHYPMSASSAARWIACPGSIEASKNCPPSPTTPAADEGTAAHLVAEFCLRTGLDLTQGNPGVLVGDREWPVTEEMAQAVRLYVDEVNRCAGQLFIERRFLLAEDMGGTVDAARVDGMGYPGLKKVTVFDFKYGRRPVKAEGNPQMMIYAKGLLNEVGTEYPDGLVSLRIVQPRCSPAVTVWDLSIRAFLEEYDRVIVRAVERAKDPSAPRLAGQHCQYCPAKKTCEAYANKDAYVF